MGAILAAFIPHVLAALRLMLAANIVGFAVRLLAGLGLYFSVMEPIGDALSGWLQGRIGGAPANVIAWLGHLNLDVYIQAVLSAYTISWGANFVMRKR